MGLDLSLSRARVASREETVFGDDEIRYAYHSENVGKDVYCLKASALPRYWFFDSCGYSGWSQIARDRELQEEAACFDLGRARAFIEGYREEIAKNNVSKFRQSDGPLEDDVAGLSDFIFYPMQVDNDRVLTHLPWEQSDVLRRLIELAGRFGRPVVIKRHPLCASDAIATWLETAAGAPNVHRSEGSIHRLIERSSCVLVANSGVGLEALLHGRPVYAMARSEYRHIANPISDLGALDALFRGPPAPQTEMTERLLGHLFLEYFVDSLDDDAIEARLRRHLTLHARGGDLAADRRRLRADIKRSAISDGIKAELASQIELLLAPGSPALEQSQDKRIEFLSEAAVLGVKRKLVLLRGGPDVCARTAEAFAREKRWKEARSFAEAAVAAPHVEGRARYVLAQVAVWGKDQERAVSELRRCLACDDTPVRAYTLLAQCLLRAGPEHHGEAEELARRALAMEPNLFNAHLLLARLAAMRENPEAVMRHFEAARALAPDHPGVLRAAETFGLAAIDSAG